MHVAIVGAGIMGLSTARALVKRGCKVSVYDQGPIPNPAASSFDEHRLIRYPYGNHTGYMRMVRSAYAAWERVWQDVQTRHYVQTGTLVLGTSPSGWVTDSKAALLQDGILLKQLKRADLAARFPYIFPDDISEAYYLDSGGVLMASRILEALALFLSRSGVSINNHCAITAVNTNTSTLQLADGRQVTADRIVITAGAWITRLLPELSPQITPSKQTILYFQLPDEAITQWQKAPMILDIDHHSGFYLVPPVAETGLKTGDHRFSLMGDPVHPVPPSVSEIETIKQATCHRIPAFTDYPIAASESCFYSVSTDERFICHRKAQTWVLTGFSGHGFKFGPLIGEDLVKTIFRELPEKAFHRWLAGHIYL